MTDTTFVSKVTHIMTSWLQAINDHVYKDTPGTAPYTHDASKVSITAGTTQRTSTAKAGDHLSVKDYGTLGDGTVANEMPSIRAAMVANPGASMFVPHGMYNGTSQLLIGGPGATVYHGLHGEGFPNYQGAANVTPSMLNFTSGSGVLMDNAYCGISNIWLEGVKAGGTNPVTDTVGNVGITLSGGSTALARSCNIENVTIEGFDTGLFNSTTQETVYNDYTNVRVINCTNGHVYNGISNDVRHKGGSTVNCTNFGVYCDGADFTNVSFTGHLFELCGIVGPSKTQVGVRTDGISAFSATDCYFELANLCAAGRKSSISLSGRCFVNSSTQLFGPGNFIIGNNTLGVRSKLPVITDLTNVAWTASNCAVAAQDTDGYPTCYKVTSVAGVGTVAQLSAIIKIDGTEINPYRISYDGLPGTQTKHWMYARFYIKFNNANAPSDGATWIGNNGFSPTLTAAAYGAGGSDGFDYTTNTDPTLWNFSDNTWWPVNLFFPIRWGAAYVHGMLQQSVFGFTFSGAAGPDYSGANPLEVYIRVEEVSIFQSIY